MKGRKTGGRGPGTPNRRTLFLRTVLEDCEISWAAELKKAIQAKDVQMVRCLTELLPYLSPKIRDVDIFETLNDDSDSTDTGKNILDLIK
jgi:hypothetical protein